MVRIGFGYENGHEFASIEILLLATEEHIDIISEEAFRQRYSEATHDRGKRSMFTVRKVLRDLWNELPVHDGRQGLPSWVEDVPRKAISQRLAIPQPWEAEVQRLIDLQAS